MCLCKCVAKLACWCCGLYYRADWPTGEGGRRWWHSTAVYPCGCHLSLVAPSVCSAEQNPLSDGTGRLIRQPGFTRAGSALQCALQCALQFALQCALQFALQCALQCALSTAGLLAAAGVPGSLALSRAAALSNTVISLASLTLLPLPPELSLYRTKPWGGVPASPGASGAQGGTAAEANIALCHVTPLRGDPERTYA